MGFLRRHPLFASLLLVLVVAVGVVAGSGVAVWRAAHTDQASRVDNADLIVVLGAAQYGGRPSPVFAGRLDHGALLYRGGFAPAVLVLGAGQPGDISTEAEAGARYLVEDGLPDDAVFALPEGGTTKESLAGAARFMDEREMGSAFLVSDPWHNLRLRRMARDLGFDGYASATWQSAAVSQSKRFSGYVRETFAYLYYRVAGR